MGTVSDDIAPVLGVDDFALRRGHVYGTVVIDMISGCPVDLLPDREAGTLAAWLRAHPGVKVICRDRAGAYAEAARLGAPDAIQVADRWHLWRNLGQAVEKTVTTRRAHLVIARPTSAETTTARRPGAVPRELLTLPEKKIIARMREQHTAVHELRARGLSKAAIGRQLGLHPATVRNLAPARTLEELTAKTEQRAHLVDDHIAYLHQRWNEGERNATGLFREITARGYQGGELAVQRYLRRRRDSSPLQDPADGGGAECARRGWGRGSRRRSRPGDRPRQSVGAERHDLIEVCRPQRGCIGRGCQDADAEPGQPALPSRHERHTRPAARPVAGDAGARPNHPSDLHPHTWMSTSVGPRPPGSPPRGHRPAGSPAGPDSLWQQRALSVTRDLSDLGRSEYSGRAIPTPYGDGPAQRD
jgi:transposase